MEIFGQILRHPLGQRRNQHALIDLNALVDLGQHVIDLRTHRTNLHFRVNQPRGTNQLLNNLGRVRRLILARRRRHENHLGREPFPLFELQRPVVERRGQPETVLDEDFLARPVALVHRANCGMVWWLSSITSMEFFGR